MIVFKTKYYFVIYKGLTNGECAEERNPNKVDLALKPVFFLLHFVQ